VTVRPVRVAAALLGLSVAPAAAQDDHGMAADAALGFPQFAGEADLRLYGVGTHRRATGACAAATSSCAARSRAACTSRPASRSRA
jgi:hypothetical protein